MAYRNILKIESPPTALELILSEIKHHRTRDLCTASNEDNSGFVILNRSTFWTDLFVRHFVCHRQDQTRDDLLFFVRKTQRKTNARYFPQYQTEIEVYRKGSKKLPIGDTEIDWEETVYLNLIVHHLDYTLTCAVCTRTSSKDLQVIRRNSIKVYASPSRRSMDSKGEMEEMTYPHIYFLVENYEEVFQDIIIRDGEMLCVELLASDHQGNFQGAIFMGSLHYEPIRRVYDARGSLSSKFAQRIGWYQPSSQGRREYVRMKGPLGKGHAEMSVSREKGTGAETPTSEPGFSLVDYDWEEELEDNPYFQRRMSDPSSNLNTFVRGSWKIGGEGNMKKSQSETEGVDSCANGINEIEACDIRDDKKHATKHTNPAPSEEELGDNTYSRLWLMRGFGQAYHFWKESRRAKSPALHAWLTYVTLPWHAIIADLINGCQTPVLTF